MMFTAVCMDAIVWTWLRQLIILNH